MVVKKRTAAIVRKQRVIAGHVRGGQWGRYYYTPIDAKGKPSKNENDFFWASSFTEELWGFAEQAIQRAEKAERKLARLTAGKRP